MPQAGDLETNPDLDLLGQQIKIRNALVHEVRDGCLNFFKLPQKIVFLRGVEWVHGLFLFPLVLGKM